METGRKFWLTAGGMVMVFALALLGKLTDGASGALGALVLSFNGANAVVNWSYARSSSASDSRAVSERRDAAAGIEPSP